MKTKLFIITMLISCISYAQNGSLAINELFKEIKKQHEVTYFEVSDEMFQMLSESDKLPPELKVYYRELSEIKMIEITGNSRNEGTKVDLYDSFLAKANLKGFSRLMVTEGRGEKLAFYKRKGAKENNEFLLFSSSNIIYVKGTIDLKSVHEFQRVLEIAGSAMGGY